MRTSSPRRWIWMRIPSSLNSTDAHSKPATASPTARAGRGEHRQDRPEDLEADGAQTRLAVGHRDLRRARQIAREHQRAARDLHADPGGLGDRGGHHSGQRALSQLSGEQPAQEVRLLVGGASQQAGEQLATARRRSAAGDGLDRVDRAIDVTDRERRLRRRRHVDPEHDRVADPDPSLAGNAGQERRRRSPPRRRRGVSAGRRAWRSSPTVSWSRPPAAEASTRSRSRVTRRERRARTCPAGIWAVRRR